MAALMFVGSIVAHTSSKNVRWVHYLRTEPRERDTDEIRDRTRGQPSQV